MGTHGYVLRPTTVLMITMTTRGYENPISGVLILWGSRTCRDRVRIV